MGGHQTAADFSQVVARVNEAQAEIKTTMGRGRDQLRAQTHQRASDRKVERDVRKAEYAVLDAARARSDADALAGRS